MCTMPVPKEENMEVVSYADDITILAIGTILKSLENRLNSYLESLNDWLTDRKLILSLPKSSTTVFTTWSREMSVKPDVKINNITLEVENTKILGVTLDSQLNFGKHASKFCEKVQQRNNILKKLAGTNCGCEKETLNITYKSIGLSILNYAAPIWTPTLSNTNWQKLQTKRNAALRTITGCVQMIPIDHLHEETNILPVKEHNAMLSKEAGTVESENRKQYQDEVLFSSFPKRLKTGGVSACSPHGPKNSDLD